MSMLPTLDRIFGFDYGKEEWYFRAREGIHGPYETREDAAWALIMFINQCIEHDLTGGRFPLTQTKMAEVVIDAPHWTNNYSFLTGGEMQPLAQTTFCGLKKD